MPQQPNILQCWWWQRRIDRMKQCRTEADLLKRCGEPDHRVSDGEVEIWHYPLRAIGGFRYSIHVAVTNSRPTQAYLHLEPQDTA